jgi:hypothetical protein
MNIEAMKLALEALDDRASLMKWQSAREALRQAIEQAEHYPPECQTEAEKTAYAFGWWKALESVRSEKQEPVAWRNAALRVGEDLCSVGPFGYYDMTAEQWLDWALSVVTVHAPPPPRHLEPVIDKSAAIRIATALGWTPPRQPLSDGEIYTAYITATNQTLRAQDERLAFAFARAIEAACIKGEV